MSFFGNITFRKKNRTQSESHETDEESNPSKNNTYASINSMPELSDEENEEMKDLKSEVIKLKNELKVAHNEIANLNLEIEQMKSQMNDMSRKNIICRKVTESLKNNCVTPKKKKGKGRKSQLENIPNSSNNTNYISHSDSEQPAHIVQDNSKKIMNTLQHGNTVKPRNKLCIMSCYKRNAVLDIAETIFNGGDYQIMHYLTPNAGIREQLKCINEKLTDFTYQDYCIIMIGEEDFTKTNNYHELIRYLRATIQNISHTNVILCTPTYNCGRHQTMYNWRVEIFNNLLYSDVESHGYAYFFDSNANLTYDNYMFSKYGGYLNNRGMRTVLTTLNQELNSLKKQNVIQNNSVTKNIQNNSSKEDNQKPTQSVNNNSNLFRV